MNNMAKLLSGGKWWLALALAGCGGGPVGGGYGPTPQIDGPNCTTTLEASPADCDANHPVALRCAAAEAKPSELCVGATSSAISSALWCCEHRFVDTCGDLCSVTP